MSVLGTLDSGAISADVFVVKAKWDMCRRTTMFNCYNCLQEYEFDQFFFFLTLTQLIATDIMSKLVVWWFHLVHISINIVDAYESSNACTCAKVLTFCTGRHL